MHGDPSSTGLDSVQSAPDRQSVVLCEKAEGHPARYGSLWGEK